MTWQTHILVLASQTADSEELLAALRARAEHGSVRFTLIVPRVTSEAPERLDRAIRALRDAGLEVEGRLADPDAMLALTEAWDPRDFDEIVVSTFPTGASRWLQADLPHRIERHTGVAVTHVVAQEPRPEVPVDHVERAATPGVLAPLGPLSWGRTRR